MINTNNILTHHYTRHKFQVLTNFFVNWCMMILLVVVTVCGDDELNWIELKGERLFVESRTWLRYPVYVGTKNKAMYGAGRTMQDMLESGKGLPLLIHVSLSSNIRVVWNLIRPTYHHHETCLLVLLNGAYDKLHHSHAYNSTCTTTAHTWKE